MKTILIVIMTFLAFPALAQNNKWENPEQEKQPDTEIKEKQQKKNKSKLVDEKYLAGAVPEVDGHVVFTLSKDVPGESANEIYQKLYNIINEIVKETKADGLQPDIFSLDRTELNYTLIAQATDGHLKITMERIRYAYEMNRRENRGFEVSAEEWITDKEALNKRQDKLTKVNGKFRIKTIDRKDNIFGRICKTFNITY